MKAEETDELMEILHRAILPETPLAFNRAHEAHAAITGYIERIIGADEEIKRLKKPGHGPCCTCQQCGLSYDDCGCGDKRERNAFRAEQRARLHNGRKNEK